MAGATWKRVFPAADLRRELREAESPIDFHRRIKRLLFPEPKARPASSPQQELWSIDEEGLPERPWRIQPDDTFHCVALDCDDITARMCVVRQLTTDAQRPKQGGRRSQWASRGQASDYPSCDSLRCAQGRGIRTALDPTAGVTWKGVGPGGRFRPPSANRGAEP